MIINRKIDLCKYPRNGTGNKFALRLVNAAMKYAFIFQKKGLGEVLKQLRQRQAEDRGVELFADWKRGEREEADRRAGGAIIAGFMYELLIESVVTS